MLISALGAARAPSCSPRAGNQGTSLLQMPHLVSCKNLRVFPFQQEGWHVSQVSWEVVSASAGLCPGHRACLPDPATWLPTRCSDAFHPAAPPVLRHRDHHQQELKLRTFGWGFTNKFDEFSGPCRVSIGMHAPSLIMLVYLRVGHRSH